jgi:hypothetical protein
MFKCLKVLSIDIALAQSNITEKAFLKGRGAQRFSSFRSTPIYCESPSKIPLHLVQMSAIGNLIANGARRSESSLRH